MTGDEIYRRFCVRIGQAYSAFSDRTKLNRTFLDALYDVTQNKSEALTQKEYDELCFQVKTERVLLVRGNKIPTVPIVIDSIIASGNVLRVTTISDHNLALADVITIAGTLGLVTLPNVLNGEQTVDGVPSGNVFEISVSSVIGTHLARTGYITHERMLTDYLHLFAARFLSEMKLPFQIEKVSQGGVIELTNRCNLRDGDYIRIDNYSSLAVIQDKWYVKSITPKKIRVYKDEKLTIPSPLNTISAVRGGTLYRIYYRYGDPITQDQKIGEFVRGSSDNAKYETADGMLKIYPKADVFTEATLDYFAKPKQAIDLNNAIIDMELYYPHKLLSYIIEDAAMKYSQNARDQALEQSSGRQMQINN